jgi:hypothetical protein
MTMRENFKKENKQTNTHNICNPPRKNQPQTLKCTGKTEEDREEKRRRKNSPQKDFPIMLVIWWLLWRF